VVLLEVEPPLFVDDDEAEVPPCDELPPDEVDLATHEPLLQLSEELQTLPHTPQLLESTLLSVHFCSP
jgi:hypothetical protein